MADKAISPPTLITWTATDVIKGIGLLAGLLIGMAVIFGLFTLPLDDTKLELALLVLLALSEAVMIMTAWFFAVEKYQAPWAALGLRAFSAKKHIPMALGVVAVAIGFAIVYDVVVEALGIDVLLPPTQPSTYIDVDSSIIILFALIAILVAPVAEEIFFRGFVFGGLNRRFGFWPAVLISAVLFSLAHIELYKLIPIFFFGLLVAWLYYKTGSIWASALVHFINNSVAVGVAFL